MKQAFILQLVATSVLCGLSFVAGAMFASEPAPTADDASQPAPAAASEADPVVEAEPVVEASPDSPEIPPGRPEWVGQKPSKRGDLDRVPVASGPYALERDAKRALDKELAAAVSKYIADHLGPRAAREIRYDAKTIKKRFVKPENVYQDVARYSVGPMHEVFVLAEFGPEFRKEIKARSTKVKASERLHQTGVAAGGALVTLLAVFGVFRWPCRRQRASG
jgi:hypothetical protein